LARIGEISLLLANIYLDPLDKHLEQLGIAFARYADDLAILVESEEAAKESSRRLADFLRDALHLELKPAKTSYVLVSQGFDFLGFRIAGGAISVKAERTRTLLDYLANLIKELGASADSWDKAKCLNRINSVVRGWRNYFLLPGEPTLEAQLKELDQRVEQIAALHLPDSVRENPAWLCHERLSTVPHDDDPGYEENAAPRAPDPGYPDAVLSGDPAGCAPRGEGDPGPQGKRLATGKSAGNPDDDEESGTPPVGTTLEDGERLYVLTHGTYVAADGEELILKKNRVEVYRRPMDKIGLIYLQGFGIGVSVDAQVKLAGHDVPVVFAPPLGNPVAVVNPIETSRSSIRRLQAIRRDEPDVVKAGMAMMAAKISNQAAVLKYFAKYRKRIDPEAAGSMTETAGKMIGLSDSISGLDPGEANIRAAALGFEGHAAALYWRQLAKLIPEGFGFGGRITLSARDPVNQCLNYIYGILYGEVWRAVVRAGLDPYFGLIHGSVRDQGSLVFDLIEEFRAPFGDRVVVGMLGRGFRPEIGVHGFLRTRSKQQLVRCFTKRWGKSMPHRSRAVAPVDLLAAQANSLAAVFQQQQSYHPYRMRW